MAVKGVKNKKCPCGKRIGRCPIHGGADLCVHETQRLQCITCNPCPHNKLKKQCDQCNNFVCALCTGRRFCSAQSLRSHMRALHSDQAKATKKLRELEVYDALRAAGEQFEYQFYIPIRTCGIQSARKHAFVDFVLYKEWGAIILQVDEYQHTHWKYRNADDVGLDLDVAESVARGSGYKLVILRYNPDEYKVSGRIRPMSDTLRIVTLLRTIRDMKEPPGFQRLFLFYDRVSEHADLPSVSAQWDRATREVSWVIRT